MLGVPNYYDPPASGNSYVSAASMTVAQLLQLFPAGPSFVGQYARVSDLYGSTDEVMRCCASAGQFYWRPQRTDYCTTLLATGGTVNLVPLATAPSVFLNGTLASNLTVALQTTNVWPGAQFDIASNSVLGAFNVTVTGLVGAATKVLAAPTTRLTVKYDTNQGGWAAF